MTCNEFEILLADFLDGNLPNEQKEGFHEHQSACAACTELARDAAGAVAFMGHVASVTQPPMMVKQILAATSGSRWSFAEWFQQWAGLILRPQLAMGVAMAILTIAVAARFWVGASDGMEKAWDRTVRGYENMQVVYEVQTQLQQWINDPANGREGEDK